jgi:hypothetical protein
MKHPQVIQESTILVDIVVGTVVVCEASEEGTRELAQRIAKVVDDVATAVVENGQTNELKEVHVEGAGRDWKRMLDGEARVFVGWV